MQVYGLHPRLKNGAPIWTGSRYLQVGKTWSRHRKVILKMRCANEEKKKAFELLAFRRLCNPAGGYFITRSALSKLCSRDGETIKHGSCAGSIVALFIFVQSRVTVHWNENSTTVGNRSLVCGSRNKSNFILPLLLFITSAHLQCSTEIAAHDFIQFT